MKIRSKFLKNTSWIFFGNVVHAVLQYVINIICARAFGANDYGLINYAASLIAFFTSIGTLGFNGIITKKFAENEENAGTYLGTGMMARLFFSVFSIVALQVIVKSANGTEPELQIIVFCQSLQILFGTADLIVYWFRFKSEAKTVALIRLFSFFIASVWKIVSIIILNNIVLYVVGVALETALFSVLLVWFFHKEYHKYKFSFDVNTLKNMLKISYPFIFSAILATVYGQTDKIMIKSMLDNNAVAMYSVSQTLAGVIAIIPTALIEGFRPDIMTYKIKDETMYRIRLKQLYGIVFWLCMIYGLFITLLARPVVLLLYGNAYIGAVPSLSLIVWYTSFSYFGAINNLYMVAENKTVWVQVTALTGAALNIGLNFFMIPSGGIVGAAAASLITQIVTNFVALYCIKPLRENFYIMVQGIILQGFKGMGIKSLIRRK